MTEDEASLVKDFFDDNDFYNVFTEKGELTSFYRFSLIFAYLTNLKKNNSMRMLQEITDAIKRDDDYVFSINTDKGYYLKIKADKQKTFETRSRYVTIVGKCEELVSNLMAPMASLMIGDQDKERMEVLIKEFIKKLSTEEYVLKIAKHTEEAFDFISNLIKQNIVSVINEDGFAMQYSVLEHKSPSDQVWWATVVVVYFVLFSFYHSKEAKKKNAVSQ